jgi:hypothetical protein
MTSPSLPALWSLSSFLSIACYFSVTVAPFLDVYVLTAAVGDFSGMTGIKCVVHVVS